MLSITSPEAHRLARELAASTHESITDAVTTALRERLERLQQQRHHDQEQFRSDLRRLQLRMAETEPWSEQDPLTWDEHGLPT